LASIKELYYGARPTKSQDLPWKSRVVGELGSAISRPYFLPSLIEVAGLGAPLEMTGETKSSVQRARS